jgi:hypothetical protein
MEILNTAFNWIMKRRIAQIERFMLHPHTVQQEVFDSLIQSAQNTEWGKKYGYKHIKTPQQYREAVPISTYEQLYPYIERCMRGEQNVLWHTPIRWFSKSSGTTNARSKFIPVSEEALEECHYKAGKDLIALYVYNYPESKFFSGKTLSIGGSYQANPYFPDSFIGDISAIITKNLPSWVEYLRTPSMEIALLENWDEKIEKMAQYTLKENVVCITGVPTWTLMLLQRILAITGKSTIKEVWNDFEVFAHGAVAFGPYRDIFNTIIGENVAYIENYNASEGYFGIQDQKNTHDEMLLMLDYGVYYEFIPFEELGNPSPKAISLHEVEIGKNYALLISTNGGLWRYLIGDTIKFTSLSPYRFKVSGRTKHYINVFGEELMVDNAEQALTKVCKELNAAIFNFTAAPVFIEIGKHGGHEWAIEFEKEPENLFLFADLLDKYLREINSDYDAKRFGDIALLPPIVHSLPKGTFYEWMRKRGKLGGQHKVPRLSNDRQYLEEILATQEINSLKN